MESGSGRGEIQTPGKLSEAEEINWKLGGCWRRHGCGIVQDYALTSGLGS